MPVFTVVVVAVVRKAMTLAETMILMGEKAEAEFVYQALLMVIMVVRLLEQLYLMVEMVAVLQILGVLAWVGVVLFGVAAEGVVQ